MPIDQEDNDSDEILVKRENEDPKPRKKYSSNIDRKTIANNIFAKLGRPKHTPIMDIHPLWDNRFRVNITVAGKIMHSYFIQTTDTGEIIRSVPEIRKSYN